MKGAGTSSSKIYFYDVVDSTQDTARKLGPVEEFTTVVAREQTKGRGRSGRQWCSPPGGLWFTIVLYPGTPIRTHALLSLISSLSIVDAIEYMTGLRAHIKWPNDVYIGEKKVAGILVESDVVGEIMSKALVGIGVNLNIPLDSLPEELRDRATTLLEEYGRKIDEREFLLAVLREFKKHYEDYRAGHHQQLIDAVKGRMIMMGKIVSVYLDDAVITGLVEDLEINGSLVIRSKGDRVVLSPAQIKKLELV